MRYFYGIMAMWDYFRMPMYGVLLHEANRYRHCRIGRITLKEAK